MRQEGRTNDDENIDDIENETSSPELAVTKIRKRIWASAKYDDDNYDSDDDSECIGSQRNNNKKRKKDDNEDSELRFLKLKWIFLGSRREAISPLIFTHKFGERQIAIRILSKELLPTDSAW